MRIYWQPQLFMGRRLINKPVRFPPSISNGFSTRIQELNMAPDIQLLGPPQIYDQNHQSWYLSSLRPGNPFRDLMLANFNKTADPLSFFIRTEPLSLRESASRGRLTTKYSHIYNSSSGSGNPCLDFFFYVEPNTTPDTLRHGLKLAWEHDALTTLKLIYHLRGARGTGKSNREGFYTAALWLHEYHPKTLAHNIKWIPQFGSFRDLPEILYRILQGSDVRKTAEIKHQRWKLMKYEHEVVPTFESATCGSGSWVDLAKDPSTGCVYYYNEGIRKSQWVSPSVAATILESPSPTIPLPPDWEEVIEDALGTIQYHNTKTGESKRCIGCISDHYWNRAQAWGYCDYCTRQQGRKLEIPRETRLAAEKQKREFQNKRKRELEKEKVIEKARKMVERYCRDENFRFLHCQISHVFADHLVSDLKFLKSGELDKVSLASKWCPSLDSSYDKITLLCESIAKRVFPRDSSPEYEGLEEAHYTYRVRDRLRKQVLVPLREMQQLPEVYMCSNRWNTLPYKSVPSVAMKNYQELFLKHDRERFIEYLSDVIVGKAKIAVGALFPHEIIQRLNKSEELCRLVAELQWKRMVNDLSEKGKLRDCIAICDVSASMYGMPMEVSVALGLLLSELSNDPWKGHVITFSQNPQLHKIEGDDLRAKVESIKEMEKGCSTNFEKAFDVILKVALDGNLSKDQMIKRVFVFTDMKFAKASGRSYPLYWSYFNDTEWESSNTDYEEIHRKFEESGYTVPEIVFWNLRDCKTTPVRSKQNGGTLLTGFSKYMMTLFLEDEELTNSEKYVQISRPEKKSLDPETVMELALSRPGYEQLVIVD